MARSILWFIVIMSFIAGIASYASGNDLSLFARILTFACLGILALCESIEKQK